MKHDRDYQSQLEQADRAVTFADQDLQSAVQVIGDGAPPRLAQIGVAAIALGLVGALIVRKGRRSGSRLSRAIDYSVLLPLAANVIPKVVAMMSSPRPPTYAAPADPLIYPQPSQTRH